LYLFTGCLNIISRIVSHTHDTRDLPLSVYSCVFKVAESHLFLGTEQEIRTLDAAVYNSLLVKWRHECHLKLIYESQLVATREIGRGETHVGMVRRRGNDRCFVRYDDAIEFPVFEYVAEGSHRAITS